MADHKEIDLLNLLMPPATRGEHLIFEDEHFKRQTLHTKLDSAIDADIIIDSLDSLKVASCHISLDFAQDRSLDFVIHNAQHTSHSRGRLITHSPSSSLLWIPKDPVSRLYDNNGRIETATEAPFEAKSDPGGVRLSVTPSPGRKVEFSVVIFTTGIEAFSKEILDCHPVELRKVVRSDWFYYEGAKDIWDYFINGVFLSTRHRVHKRAWPGQNIPFVLYHYLDFLHNRTKKQIYRLLCDLIAYAVMLSLPDNGRWRHGIWTDIVETHTVHQAAGIHLFLSHYQHTAAKIFLQKAALAADYLISIADDFSDSETWFLHDTLETNPDDAALFYNLFASTAFGKSTSNTLCINSHIAALTALHRLNQLDPSDKYSTYFEKGLSALKKVLQANPCDWLYSCAYRPRDLLMRLCTKTENKLVKKLNKVWTLTLIRHLLPFLKKRFPRLLMPNGFIERDLSYSALSDFYHFRNLEDILILYNLTKADWLLNIVTKSIRHTVDSRLAACVMDRDPKAILFLDTLLLYAGIINQNYIHLLPPYLAHFQKANSVLPVNILSDPFITDTSLPLRVDNDKVIVLVPAAGKKLKAILVNITQKDEKVAISLPSENAVDELEVIDSSYQKSSLSRELIVPKMGYVKIVSKDG
ncbi:MAG: D-glucuronyl C5-epimerase family protein [Planctomycetota bacterium]|jgi:hypothetical protein